MFDCLCIRGALVFQHIFDQIDPATRAVQLIPKYLVSGTGGSAKSAMDARSQDLIGAGGVRIFELFLSELCLHAGPAMRKEGKKMLHRSKLAQSIVFLE
jgi:hypothetical protein